MSDILFAMPPSPPAVFRARRPWNIVLGRGLVATGNLLARSRHTNRDVLGCFFLWASGSGLTFAAYNVRVELDENSLRYNFGGQFRETIPVADTQGQTSYGPTTGGAEPKSDFGYKSFPKVNPL